jgi:hypothetical protein
VQGRSTLAHTTNVDWDSHITRSAYFETEEVHPPTRSVPEPTSAQAALRALNRGLRRTVGLEIRRPAKPRPAAPPLMTEDMCFIVSSDLSERRLDHLVDVLSGFFDALGIRIEPTWLKQQIRRYDELFRARPVQDLRFGTGYNNGLIIFCFFSALKPSQVIESGVWMGFSTYLIDNALPEGATIHSFDIDLSVVAWRSERAEYFERDVTTGYCTARNVGSASSFSTMTFPSRPCIATAGRRFRRPA